MSQQMMVFASHAHEDDTFCRAVVQALRGAGANVWYDEHNLSSGQLMEVIQRELGRRPVVVVILSRAAFASPWVRREVTWAYQLLDRDPSRLILPITCGPIKRNYFDPAQGWLFLEGFKRIEAPGMQPYPVSEAVQRLLHALALTPAGERPEPTAPQPMESVEDVLARGKALAAQNKFAEAVPLFQRATQLAPRSFDVWANLGFAYHETRQYRLALDANDHALALDEKQMWVWYNKGIALRALKRYQEALAACDRSLALDPNYAQTWGNKAALLHNLQRYGDALAAREQQLRLDPQNAQGWRYKAETLRAMGRTTDAEETERRAKELGG
jgi:tetratricopeptide (TPR) repeat protein